MLSKSVAAKTARFLDGYAVEKDIYLKVSYFNAEHVHTLIDLPTTMAIDEVVKLFKGGSSHWINEKKLLRGRFGWGRGYGAFSVSQSHVGRVAAYIANQGEHHRRKTFDEEFESFVNSYGLKWRKD